MSSGGVFKQIICCWYEFLDVLAWPPKSTLEDPMNNMEPTRANLQNTGILLWITNLWFKMIHQLPVDWWPIHWQLEHIQQNFLFRKTWFQCLEQVHGNSYSKNADVTYLVLTNPLSSINLVRKSIWPFWEILLRLLSSWAHKKSVLCWFNQLVDYTFLFHNIGLDQNYWCMQPYQVRMWVFAQFHCLERPETSSTRDSDCRLSQK